MRQHGKFLAAALVLFSAYAGMQNSAAQSLVPNGGFESGISGWSIFVPDESSGKNCKFDVVSTEPHSGTNCVRLQSDDFARYAIGAGSSFPVQPGEHYRVSIWIRADAAALIRPKTSGMPPAAGPVIRILLRGAGSDTAGGHLFIGMGNTVARDTPSEWSAPLPKDWTKIEAVVEIPPGADTAFPSLFCWWTSGTLYADDFEIEKVAALTASASTPPNAPTP